MFKFKNLIKQPEFNYISSDLDVNLGILYSVKFFKDGSYTTLMKYFHDESIPILEIKNQYLICEELMRLNYKIYQNVEYEGLGRGIVTSIREYKHPELDHTSVFVEVAFKGNKQKEFFSLEGFLYKDGGRVTTHKLEKVKVRNNNKV